MYKACMLVRCCSFSTVAAGCAEGRAGLQQVRGVCLSPAHSRPCVHCRHCSRERATSVTSSDRSLSPVSDYRAARDRGSRPGRSTRRREQPRQVSHHGAIFAPASCIPAAAQKSMMKVLAWYSHAWQVTSRLRGDTRFVALIACKANCTALVLLLRSHLYQASALCGGLGSANMSQTSRGPLQLACRP